MQIDDLVLLYNTSDNDSDKHDELINFIFTEAYTFVVSKYLMSKEEVGAFLEHMQPRFEHILSSYVEQIIPFKR